MKITLKVKPARISNYLKVAKTSENERKSPKKCRPNGNELKSPSTSSPKESIRDSNYQLNSVDK